MWPIQQIKGMACSRESGEDIDRQRDRQTDRQIVRSFRQNEQTFASGAAGLWMCCLQRLFIVVHGEETDWLMFWRRYPIFTLSLHLDAIDLKRKNKKKEEEMFLYQVWVFESPLINCFSFKP